MDPQLSAALADRYPLERELGRGGMATVYLARDPKHHRPVAVKVLRPELSALLGADRFLREIEIAAQFAHPHILPLFDSGDAGGHLYYVMPYIEGESLRARLVRERQLPVDEALRLASEVADALGYAHSRGVVHRDIKPENILLVGGHAVVTDFGIARAIDAAGAGRLTETGLAVGTPAYMSPEQAAAQPVDGRSDLYGLGCVLYEALAGELPFSGPTAQAIAARRLTDTPRPLRETRETVPDAVDTVVRRLLARTPADRYATAAQLAEALAAVGAVARTPPGMAVLAAAGPARRRWLAAGIILGVTLGGAALGVAVLRRPQAPTLDEDLLAVAPFDVLAPQLALWREGLVDLLAKNLDGAGNLRTSSPSTYLKDWSGRADRSSAEALGRRTGAALVVFGDLVTVGSDSVRLRAALLEVGSAEAPLEVEVRGPEARLGSLGDSLSVALLRVLGRRRPAAAVRQSLLGAHSLPALKEFLQGEQAYRELEYDSALAHYDRAIAADSEFALAYRKMALGLGFDPRTSSAYAPRKVYLLKAAGLNRGLSTRDSLLILGDSLWGLAQPTLPHWTAALAVMRATVALYPGDPEAWLALGDFVLHRGGPLVPRADALDAFEHAIALDSGFAPAYEHVFGLAVQLGAVEHAVELLRAFTRHVPTDVRGLVGPLRLVAALLGPDGYPDPEALRAADSAPATDVFRAFTGDFFGAWPDSGEIAIQLARRFREGGLDARGAPPWVSASEVGSVLLSRSLADRGHLAEAYAAYPRYPSPSAGYFTVYPEMALLGGVPAESVSSEFSQALVHESVGGVRQRRPLLWWLSRRDTASLIRFTERADSAARAASSPAREATARDAAVARAYVLLIAGDSAEALRRLQALDDSICVLESCSQSALVEAQLLAAAHRPREAADLLDQYFYHEMDPLSILAMLARARAAATLGERDRAIDAYQFVLDAWREADPVLEPYVTEAREGLRRLVARDR